MALQEAPDDEPHGPAPDEPLDERQFAEQFAPLIPTLQPIAGRMLGLLLVSNQQQLSSRELMERLGVSAGSISTMGRLLTQAGFVVRSVSVETRHDLFRLREDAWASSQWKSFVETVEKTIQLLDEAIARCPDEYEVTRTKLIETRDYYAFLSEDLPLQDARYQKWRARERRKRAAEQKTKAAERASKTAGRTTRTTGHTTKASTKGSAT